MRMRHELLLLAFAVGVPLAHVQAAKWPEKPVRMIVPFAPGGGADILARIVAPHLSAELGQYCVVDNRAGGGGTIGAQMAARATPDGYTIILVPSSYAANAAVYKLAYNPVKDIAPISTIATGARVLAVNLSVKANNLKELIALARAKPGSLNFGSSGTGSVIHLTTEYFLQMTRTKMVHVPYKGEGPAVVDLLAGEIQVFFGGPLAMLPQIRAGRLRGLGVTTEQRLSAMPDLPSISEVVPGYSVLNWFGIWAPEGTPKAIILQLNQAIGRVLNRPDMQERLRGDGLEPAYSTPEQFAHLVASQIAIWSKVVKAGNIKVN